MLVLLDGQRLNGDWNGGKESFSSIIDLEKIERIEFIRGPGSAIYGSNAYLGVINLISQASNEVNVSLTTLRGNGTQTQASAQWQAQVQSMQTQVFVNVINDEGQRLKVFDPFKDDFVASRDPFSFKEVYLKVKGESLNLSLYHSITQSEQFYVSGFVSNDENVFDTTSSFVDVSYQRPLTQQWTLNSKLSLSKKRLDIASIISPALPPNELGISGEIEEQEPQAEVTMSFKGDNGQKALAGLEWRRPKIIDSDANLFGAVNLYLPQAPLTHRTIYGLFVQYQADISSQLHYVLGLRHDDYSNFGAHSSPRGGLIWQFSDEHTFKWLYGESFRAPSRSETDIQNSSALVANPDLLPEVARTTEFIWQHRLTQNFLTTTVFYTELDDVISNAQTTPIERYNTGDETLAGIELEWHRSWSQNLSSRLNASWVFDGPSQANSEAEAFMGASIVHSTQGYSAALMINHHSSKQDEYVANQVNVIRSVPSRSFLNIHVRRFYSDDIELYAKLDNITDESYNSVSQRAGNDQGVPNRGVSLMTGLRWDY